MSKELRNLNIECLNEEQRKIYDKVTNSPIKIMQVGEGNFLMSFFDWMVYQAIKMGKYDGSIALTCPLNYNKKIDLLNEQDKLYTVIQRGFKGDTEVYENDIVSVFSKVYNYNKEWDTFMNIAEQESLEVIISNTTEAGLAYKEVKFKAWVNENCVFLNNLVDRIVPGFPSANEDEYFENLGYKDGALSMCEPYFLWAIEGDKELDNILPLNASGLNVQWLESLKDTQLLKVRILNGSHTLITPLSILKGFKQVDEVIENDEMKAFLNETLENEILPSLKNKTGNKEEFASTVLSRFRNPHIMHKLESISMNSVSKFANRLWPTVKTYIEDNNKAPKNIMVGLAGLIIL